MTPKRSLDLFLAKYDPSIAKAGRQALAAMRKLLPGAFELVYDNYNALAIGFAATERARDAVMSIALYPRWVSLFFLSGASLADPEGRLRGSGTRVRHVVLANGAATLAERAVQSLIHLAIAQADPPLPQSGKGKILIKSVSARQRPRRPARLKARLPSRASRRAARR
jgi:hypothetical protein